ncbi:MAG: LapA family protein [Campylobacter sp.]|uniref:LapA family protein n=1 Tax=unclassified Campylobacter TaxID=2593542 RepID=UPI001B67A2B2|nr:MULTISPECIES: LapA family protein [unclassified Campylobacter]MBP5779176.1 LapA family protein [Campylobacter sp.]MBQ2430554.1 LapA family protein [Campylobacter sp.]MBQ9876764.1 LapA family protein [Campylobacter sp.]MBR4141788.1 LapA family protein [Campylobacter sp.]MBR6952451.1 LapA family protein [Campylobacter sp.]
MKTKQFFLYSIIFIAIIAVSVFSQVSGSYALDLFGFELNLPIAAWFVLPLVLYMLLTIFHFAYHSFCFYRTKRAISKDLSTYEAMSKDVLLGLDTNKDFKTEFFKNPSSITKVLSPWYDSSDIVVDNPEIKAIIDTIEKVKKGEVVDLKKFKLPKDNGLFLQNELNRLDTDPKYAHEILKAKGVYSQDFINKAYNELLQSETYLEIKKYGIPSELSEVNLVIDRYVKKDIEIATNDLFEMLNNEKFSEADFINFAKKLQVVMAPESYKAFFERLKNENSNATEAYLYALYELGMIDELREQIGLSDGDEHEKFNLLLFLKDNGKNVPASLIF